MKKIFLVLLLLISCKTVYINNYDDVYYNSDDVYQNNNDYEAPIYVNPYEPSYDYSIKIKRFYHSKPTFSLYYGSYWSLYYDYYWSPYYGYSYHWHPYYGYYGFYDPFWENSISYSYWNPYYYNYSFYYGWYNPVHYFYYNHTYTHYYPYYNTYFVKDNNWHKPPPPTNTGPRQTVGSHVENNNVRGYDYSTARKEYTRPSTSTTISTPHNDVQRQPTGQPEKPYSNQPIDRGDYNYRSPSSTTHKPDIQRQPSGQPEKPYSNQPINRGDYNYRSPSSTQYKPTSPQYNPTPTRSPSPSIQYKPDNNTQRSPSSTSPSYKPNSNNVQRKP